MPSSKFVIDIGIPVDITNLLSTRLLLQAGSGGGKSYAGRKLMESIAGKFQQLIIDPEGDFVTLREKFDFLLVSKEGDIPISLRYAEALAHKLLKTGVSAILDLYELKPTERKIFVQRFGDALLNAPKALWHPMFLYIDEAHMFAPEGAKSESLDTVIGLCSRGRKRQYCPILMTQRISKLHKDAAAECRNKLIGLATLDIDRNRAGEELGFTNKKDNLVLRSLEPGEFFAFGPSISNDIRKFKVGKVVTTHEHARKGSMDPVPTPAAIKKILSELKDIPEEAEKELTTRQQLQTEVTRLRSEVTRLSKGMNKQATETVDAKAIDRAVDQARKEVTAHYVGLLKERDVAVASVVATIKKLQSRLSKIAQLANQQDLTIDIPETKNVAPLPQATPARTERVPPRRPVGQPVNGHKVDLPEGEVKILTASAQFPNGLRRDQFTVMTNYKRSSRDAYIQRLKAKGYVEQQSDRIVPTAEGLSALGPNFEPLPTGGALQEFWLTNLPEGERKLLKLLIEAYPNGMDREALSTQSGYLRSSRDAYIQRMAAKEILDLSIKGQVRASDNLFN